MSPNIIRRGELIIAGIRGDGDKTGEAWQAFETLSGEKPLTNALSEDGYEARLYDGEKCSVHVGRAVSSADVDPAYNLALLPASEYASFDVYVAKGYASENASMEKWLASNAEGYTERLLGGSRFCVERYGERFRVGEADSIVEIWIPVEKR